MSDSSPRKHGKSTSMKLVPIDDSSLKSAGEMTNNMKLSSSDVRDKKGLLEAARRLEASGIDCQIVELYRLKPVNSKDIVTAFGAAERIVVVDEHSPIGGLATIVAEAMVREGVVKPMEIVSLPDQFLLGSSSRDWAHETYGLSATKLESHLKT